MGMWRRVSCPKNPRKLHHSSHKTQLGDQNFCLLWTTLFKEDPILNSDDGPGGDKVLLLLIQVHINGDLLSQRVWTPYYDTSMDLRPFTVQTPLALSLGLVLLFVCQHWLQALRKFRPTDSQESGRATEIQTCHLPSLS